MKFIDIPLTIINKSSKGTIASVLDNIPGIGNKRKELIKAFGSVKI